MNWQATIVDVVTLLVVGALAFVKVLPGELAAALFGAVISKYATLTKPPEPPAASGGGGVASALGGSAVGTILFALLGGYARSKTGQA